MTGGVLFHHPVYAGGARYRTPPLWVRGAVKVLRPRLWRAVVPPRLRPARWPVDGCADRVGELVGGEAPSRKPPLGPDDQINQLSVTLSPRFGGGVFETQVDSRTLHRAPCAGRLVEGGKRSIPRTLCDMYAIPPRDRFDQLRAGCGVLSAVLRAFPDAEDRSAGSARCCGLLRVRVMQRTATGNRVSHSTLSRTSTGGLAAGHTASGDPCPRGAYRGPADCCARGVPVSPARRSRPGLWLVASPPWVQWRGCEPARRRT